MLKGSCHCKSIAFEHTGSIIRFSNCHCDDCRKVNGAAYAAALVVSSNGFRITAGEDQLTAYESSPGKHRYFCKRCGSPMHTTMKARPEVVILRAGTLDEGPGMRPQMHIWVKAKAPWYDILDDLPQHQQGPPPA